MYTNHGLNRVLERVVLKQNKKFNKKQRKKYKNIAIKKYQTDFNNRFATYKCRNGNIYIYTDLKNNNECTKYILSPRKKIITVVKVLLEEEKIKYNLILKK